MSVGFRFWVCGSIIVSFLFLHVSVAFHSPGAFAGIHNRACASRVFMGRAANVRAATKSKTDAAKAKKNNRYAKKVSSL